MSKREGKAEKAVFLNDFFISTAPVMLYKIHFLAWTVSEWSIRNIEISRIQSMALTSALL